MKILTNDPSMTAWGWAVIHLAGGRSRIIDYGCIKTKPESKKRRIRKSDDLTRRLNEISKKLLAIHHSHDLDWVLSEAPHGSRSASAAKMIGAVAGIVSGFATTLNLPVEWYSEADAKKHVLGKRSATKREMVNAMLKVYGDSWYQDIKYKDEAVADSLAIFHTARESSQALIFASNQ